MGLFAFIERRDDYRDAYDAADSAQLYGRDDRI